MQIKNTDKTKPQKKENRNPTNSLHAKQKLKTNQIDLPRIRILCNFTFESIFAGQHIFLNELN